MRKWVYKVASLSLYSHRIWRLCDECFTCWSCIGLSMTIDIQQHEYLKQTGDIAGAIVVIHPQNQMPFPEDDGILVSPGHATSIGITQVWSVAVLRNSTVLQRVLYAVQRLAKMLLIFMRVSADNETCSLASEFTVDQLDSNCVHICILFIVDSITETRALCRLSTRPLTGSGMCDVMHMDTFP